jgi:hypothetical protein
LPDVADTSDARLYRARFSSGARSVRQPAARPHMLLAELNGEGPVAG